MRRDVTPLVLLSCHRLIKLCMQLHQSSAKNSLLSQPTSRCLLEADHQVRDPSRLPPGERRRVTARWKQMSTAIVQFQGDATARLVRKVEAQAQVEVEVKCTAEHAQGPMPRCDHAPGVAPSRLPEFQRTRGTTKQQVEVQE